MNELQRLEMKRRELIEEHWDLAVKLVDAVFNHPDAKGYSVKYRAGCEHKVLTLETISISVYRETGPYLPSLGDYDNIRTLIVIDNSTEPRQELARLGLTKKGPDHSCKVPTSFIRPGDWITTAQELIDEDEDTKRRIEEEVETTRLRELRRMLES